MKTEIKYIGITDYNDNVHAVTFTPGVNIITGRSSTGKSALIEIFDYCFGSADFTVPVGVITDNAKFYFTVIKINNTSLVLARQAKSTKAFLKHETDIVIINNLNSFKSQYFEADYFMTMDDFKKNLRGYFGKNIQITDIEENLENRKYRGNKKLATPSIRSFTSFILQHQNLIANKHALFYRFDEKEKREQVIDHFKIFVGFVDQEYYIKKQRLAKLELEEKRLKLKTDREQEIKNDIKYKIIESIEDFKSIGGIGLNIENFNNAIESPKKYLEEIKSTRITVASLSEYHNELKEKYERSLAQHISELRKNTNLLSDIKASIRDIEEHKSQSLEVPSRTEFTISECPFCYRTYDSVKIQANDLSDAISWLNSELEISEYYEQSFREYEQKVINEILLIKDEITKAERNINKIELQTEELEKFKTQYELALKDKSQIEIYLEDYIGINNSNLNDELQTVSDQISEINKYIKKNYNIQNKLNEAENIINNNMAEICKTLDFENEYKPINLKFSLETFDLWNEKDSDNKKEQKKIFIRSMGSGANWLSSHITLFLALNKYFCSLGDKCAIPTTVFFDQPSQVYFPSILDNTEDFSAKNIAIKEGKEKEKILDHDIKAVTNLYSTFVNYCNDTYRITGIMPQLIITDHADHLEINNSNDANTFNKLVGNRRWRAENEGFINKNLLYQNIQRLK